MYTNGKVIDLNKINFIVKYVNEIAPNTKIGNLNDERRKELTQEGFNMRAAGSELTYDELLYLQEHIELIKEDYDKIELNNIIINWVIIIQNINKALESRTIDEYLSKLFGTFSLLRFPINMPTVTLYATINFSSGEKPFSSASLAHKSKTSSTLLYSASLSKPQILSASCSRVRI